MPFGSILVEVAPSPWTAHKSCIPSHLGYLAPGAQEYQHGLSWKTIVPAELESAHLARPMF